MSTIRMAIRGTLKSDRILELDEGVELPLGRVHGWVETEADPEEGVLSGPERAARFRAFMAELRAGQQARGHKPRTAEEIDADIRAMRDESEERFRRLDEIRATGRRQG
ncbi:MAG: hypothetical protein KKI08_16770 [Armatimonadetes bacterium]|nr:hypothetical protein [Armatimonadota bacterium]